ncbi:MAG: FAD-linked oxidase C-terminal domain-containing protein [Bacteroidia bacterium]|nr:FAD-linked oxidase C-terminal domain-containing protein [Bacteroidia bacterium]
MNLPLMIQELRQQIRGDLHTDDYSLGLYATDASIYQIKPLAIVAVKDETDVITAVKIARHHGVTILPRGGGTSLAGQTVGQSLVLDFSRYMNQVLEFNEAERWVRVQPGLVRDELNAFLAPYRLHFAPDPATSSRANVGGMIGNNSSGTNSILYGKTVDHVLEARFLLADGTLLHVKNCGPEEWSTKAIQNNREGEIYRRFREIIHQNRTEIETRFPKVMRRVGGYNLDEFIHTDQWNLAKIFTGSEGTLGVMLEAKINLEPLPKYESVCVVHYHSVLDAIRSVETMLKYQPVAVEILDHVVLQLSRENLGTAPHSHFIEGNPAAILIVEFYGETPEDVQTRPLKMIEELKSKGMGYAHPFFTDAKNHDDVWVIRKKGLGLMLGIKGKAKPLPFIEDAGIPIPYLPEYIDRVLKLCAELDTKVSMYAHASVGVIHVRPILDLREETDIKKLTQIAERTFALVMEYGGSWSGEHGDGLVRSPFNEKFFGPVVYQALRDVKALFDPENRMNPGKIVEAPPMDQNLRYGKSYRSTLPETLFHYRQEEGFEAAVDMCTGVGECRKVLTGTMCPSFIATRNEEHSTRGRANALRLAMSGQLDEEGLTSPRLREVLDLCLSCKGCKSECPSNVDMARLKSDVSQLYYDKHGLTFRDKLIRNTHKAAQRFSGGLAPAVNRVQKTKLFRLALEKMAGFDSRRTLPEYAAETFEKWYRKQPVTTLSGKPKVILFADTFLNHHEPEVGIAAFNLLKDCGYEVIPAFAGCCQRPKISHGFLREAKTDGEKTLRNLDVFVQEKIPIVAVEPSCASALTDDLPDLLDDAALGERIKRGVKMIDVFLAEEKAAGRLKVTLELIADTNLLHGHCHQKALYGTKAMQQLVSGNGKSVKEIPSGCCGMAGSFGYEKEHYELSAKIGDRKLFPAIKSAETQTGIIACGFSCRHQIEHFTGRKARHWVEMVRVKNDRI